MLPRVNVVVPTDAFYALSTDEARQLNEDGGDPITGDDYPRGREADEEGATFRITTRGADGRPNHQYYDAATLWRWARDHRTDPRRNPWFYEDWMALRNQYAPGSQIPPWVNALPRADALRTTYQYGTTYYWDDSVTPSRVVRKVASDGVKTHYVWNAEKGINYRSMKEYPEDWNENFGGAVLFYDFYDQPDPRYQSPGSDWNWSQLVKMVNARKGWTRFYVGPARGGERMVRQQFTRPGVDELWHYGSNPGAGEGLEYLIRIVHGPGSAAKGQVWNYRGNVKGEESLSEIAFPNGQVDYYAGRRGGEVRHKSYIPTAKGSWITLRYDNAGKVISLIDELTDTTTTYT